MTYNVTVLWSIPFVVPWGCWSLSQYLYFSKSLSPCDHLLIVFLKHCHKACVHRFGVNQFITSSARGDIKFSHYRGHSWIHHRCVCVGSCVWMMEVVLEGWQSSQSPLAVGVRSCSCCIADVYVWHVMEVSPGLLVMSLFSPPPRH